MNFKKEVKIGVVLRKCDFVVVLDFVVNILECFMLVVIDILFFMREFVYKLNYIDKEIDVVIKIFGIEININ